MEVVDVESSTKTTTFFAYRLRSLDGSLPLVLPVVPLPLSNASISVPSSPFALLALSLLVSLPGRPPRACDCRSYVEALELESAGGGRCKEEEGD